MIPLPADDFREVSHEEIVRKTFNSPWWQICVLPADGAFDSAREHQISGMETMSIINMSLLLPPAYAGS